MAKVVQIKERYGRFIQLANDFPSLKSLGAALDSLDLGAGTGGSESLDVKFEPSLKLPIAERIYKLSYGNTATGANVPTSPPSRRRVSRGPGELLSALQSLPHSVSPPPTLPPASPAHMNQQAFHGLNLVASPTLSAPSQPAFSPSFGPVNLVSAPVVPPAPRGDRHRGHQGKALVLYITFPPDDATLQRVHTLPNTITFSRAPPSHTPES